MKILFIADPLDSFKTYKDSTYAMMVEADRRGHELHYIAQRCIAWKSGRVIAETQPLDFHSPYGCSKGAGDQYVRDYARIYGLKTVVFRQSAIYGPRQFGVEDQGWVAWFCIRSAHVKPVTIYGDG